MRQTWHTVTIEETTNGGSQVNFECQTCKKPYVRTDLVTADMTSAKKEIIEALNRTGVGAVSYRDSIIPETFDDVALNHEIKKWFVQDLKRLFKHWKLFLVIIVCLTVALVLNNVFKVV